MAPRVMPEKRAKIETEAEFWIWQCAQRKLDEIQRLALMLGLSESTVQTIWDEIEDRVS